MKSNSDKKRPHLCLIGFSGSGKSTAGRMVAKQLRRRIVDIDAQIASARGVSISEIFESRGERYFRKLDEKEIRKQFNSGCPPSVVAIGGGGFENAITRRLLLENTVVVYLKCSLSEIMRRMKAATDRPLLNVPARERREFIRSLFAERRAHYEMAHITVTTSGKTVGAVTREICRKYKTYERSKV